MKTKHVTLKLQSCELCNNKYMIASTQITNKFMNRKDNRNC